MVNSELEQSTQLVNSQLSFGKVNSALSIPRQITRTDHTYGSAHELQQAVLHMTHIPPANFSIIYQISSELSELNTVSAALNHTNFRRHTDVSVVIWVYGIFRTLSYKV
ncbi:hypothetical protein F511_30294 [Dorcoceras hygrometricum]|uniref:Uncharacterized protein n=1 Tax=Dorcoceras hygrometricum TaxID=472368 RepID=A0A2Z7BHE0_9LAMI|nr:hypothetical protein F511_30294 [Dorcoceras hygrometricum]